jgi:cysteine desulfurase
LEAYLDNSATTPLCEEAVAAMVKALTNCWGNPSSMHAKGQQAEKLLEQSRSEIAKKLSCRDEEVYFTAGGTEGNNIVLFGTAYALKRQGNRIVTTSVEHPSVYEPIKQLENEGFEVVRLKVDNTGRISEDELCSAVNSKTILVSIMAVNNEVGTLQPIETAKKAVEAARSPALVHCDAVQAFGKTAVKPYAMGADLVTLSSHKIHGPKGAGAVYIKKGTRLVPRFFGGTQEGKIRPGTHPMPAITGFGAAVKALPDIAAELENIAMLRDYFFCQLKTLQNITINSPPDAIPYVVNISVLGILSDHMLNFLSERGVYVSSGSACAKGQKSRVLTEMGLDIERLSSPLRISFSRFTTKEHLDMLLEGIAEGQKRFLRK